MSDHVFVVSEWLAKEGCEEELYNKFKELMALTKKNEPGCIRAHATKQLSHPGSPGKSKYTIILLQQYVDVDAFDSHCNSEYVAQFVDKYLNTLVEDWRCRLFGEDG